MKRFFVCLYNKMIYDFIIVGAGIAGLYTAYRIQKINPKAKVLILEREPHVGGRMGTVRFHGVDIAIGAGIGRKKKDVLLIKLLEELNIPFHEFTVGSQNAPTIDSPVDVRKVFRILRSYHALDKFEGVKKPMTFRQFALPILGASVYKNFLICSGYTDYEKEDVYETLYHYGMEDNTDGWTGLSIPWNQLLENLVKQVRVKTSQNIVKIEKNIEDRFSISNDKGVKFESKKVILASTIDTVRKLLPGIPLFKRIEGQPFLRIYGHFDKKSNSLMREHVSISTMLPGVLHRIIPMDIEKGVYMIAYTDNRGAEALESYIENTPENRDYLCRLLEKSLGFENLVLHLTEIRSFYWDIGTHYFTRGETDILPILQHPVLDEIYVVGEMASHNQGWVEGALESVDLCLKTIEL